MKRVEITNLSLKDNFLLLDSAEDNITAVVNQFNTAGIQVCVVGHLMRAGTNPADAVLNYTSRLFDLPIKDVTGVFKDARPIELGRGAINFPELRKALKKIDYNELCSHEHEKDMTDLLPGLSESAGFFKGVMQTT